MKRGLVFCYKKIFVAISIFAIASLLTLIAIGAATGNYSPVTGVTVAVAGATEDSEADGVIAVTAKGSGGIFGVGASSKTATITVTVETSVTANVSFDWAGTSINTLIIDGTTYTASSGSFEKEFSENGSFKITVTTGKNSTENTLKLSNFALTAVQESSKITFVYDTNLGSVTAGGSAIASGTTQEISSDAGVALVASPKSGSTFLGWVDTATGQRLDTATSYTYTPKVDATIKAVFVNEGSSAWFLAGGNYLFDDWDKAMACAAASTVKTVVLMNDATLAKGDYEVPSGITLLIPYNSEHTVITSDMGDHVSSTSDAKTLYRQLTLSSGTTITVHGAISVGSQASRQMVGQVGSYGAIVLNEGSNITIDNGGFLYAWGYIFPGDDGVGTVTVLNGGTVYEAAMIMDYPGSAGSAKELYDAGVFPLRAYTLRNVEVPATFQYGSKNLGFYCIYMGSINMNLPGFLTFIGSDGGDSPIFYMMDNVATIEKSYASGKQTINLKGNMTLSSISVKLSIYTIASSKTSGLVLPSGYIVSHSDGTLTLGDNVILTEGSKISVAASSTIDTNGKNIYILDATDDAPGAVSVTDIHGTSYTRLNQDAVLDINGTLKVSGGFYTSPGKASVISSEGTGKIEITTASSDTTLAFKVDKSGTNSITVNPAYLQNKDGKYLQSTAVGTYKNIGGYWHFGETHTYTSTVTNPTCTEGGFTTYKCQYCPDEYTGDTVAATGHSYSSVVTAPTCTEDGYTTHTCSTCGDSYTDGTVAATGHSAGDWGESVNGIKSQPCSICGDILAQRLTSTLTLEYRTNDYIWLNAIVELPAGPGAELAMEYDGVSLVDLGNGTYYVVRKVVAKDIPDALKIQLTLNGVSTVELDVSFKAYSNLLLAGYAAEGNVGEVRAAEIQKWKDFLAAIETYGEAAYIYFTSSEKTTYNDDDTKTAPTLTMGTDVDKAMSITVNPATDVEGVTLKTNSARVYFDEALRMSVFFTPNEFDNSKIVKIGLLATPGILETTGELTVSNHETMYVLYSKTKPEILGGSENYPDAEIKDEVNGTVKVDDAAVVYGSLATVDGRWEVCFDLTNDMYSKAYELRPFVLLDDGSYVYGDQVHYSLAAYISRTYENADKAFKNLLVATWDYVVAADAAF